MGKEKTDRAGAFLTGGSTHMFSQMGVEPSEPGVSAPVTPPAAKNNAPAGGSGGVMGKQGGAAPAVSGGVSVGGRAGNNDFSVKGGSGKMFGYTPASPAKPL
jgi:hypothetical protein